MGKIITFSFFPEREKALASFDDILLIINIIFYIKIDYLIKSLFMEKKN